MKSRVILILEYQIGDDEELDLKMSMVPDEQPRLYRTIRRRRALSVGTLDCRRRRSRGGPSEESKSRTKFTEEGPFRNGPVG